MDGSYTTDNVDVEVKIQKWMRVKGENKSFEGQVTAQEGFIEIQEIQKAI